MDQTLIFRATAGTIKQKRALVLLAGNGGNVYRAMKGAGYSEISSRTPAKLLKSKGFQELMDEVLGDERLTTVHSQLLESKAIDHLVFPLAMSDDEITELVESVGGTVRKFKHGETATHVWFWAANTKARHDALKLAYDLKGRLGKQEAPVPVGDVYNTQFNINAPSARQLADDTLKILMERTKRKVVANGAQ